MAVVTRVTARAASADELSEADYREIYIELRSKTTLRGFAEFIGSQYSFAWWSKFERGAVQLTRQARRELRQAVGLPALPPSVAEAMAGVDPDATVYRIDGETEGAAANRVVLVAVPGSVVMSLNGELRIGDQRPEDSVTAVTRRRARKTVSIGPNTWARLNEARRRAGKTWDTFLDELIEDQENRCRPGF